MSRQDRALQAAVRQAQQALGTRGLHVRGIVVHALVPGEDGDGYDYVFASRPVRMDADDAKVLAESLRRSADEIEAASVA